MHEPASPAKDVLTTGSARHQTNTEGTSQDVPEPANVSLRSGARRILRLQRTIGNAATAALLAQEARYCAPRRPSAPGAVQRWTNPVLSLKSDAELIKDAKAGDTEALKHVDSFTGVSPDDALTFIDMLNAAGSGWGRNVSALEKLWALLGADFMKLAGQNEAARWKKSVGLDSSLKDKPEIKKLQANFPQDVKAVATDYLFGNRQFVMGEMGRLGLPADPAAKPAAMTGAKAGEMQLMQQAAALIAKNQKAQEEAKEKIFVGYHIEQSGSGVSAGTSDPTQQSPSILVQWMPDTFDPYHPPSIVTPPNALGNVIPKVDIKPYDQVKEKYDAAGKSIKDYLVRYPALYAISREGKSSVTGAFAKVNDPAKAREELAKGMRGLLATIDATQTRLDSGKLDPLDLTPIHDQLYGGKVATSGTQWKSPVETWAAKDLVADHKFTEALVAMGLQVAAEALFLIAPLTGGAALFVMLAGLAVTAAKADMSAQKYEALSDAAKTAATPGTDLVNPEQVDEAKMTAEADKTALELAALAVGTAAAGELIGAVTAPKNLPGTTIPTDQVRFSQSSVSDVAELEASMRAKGWDGPPIDVVRMPDGKLTTLDNTRVLAAHRAGIPVQAVVHAGEEALPAEMVTRFSTKKGTPATWGDAVDLRIGKQNAGYRGATTHGSQVTGSAD